MEGRGKGAGGLAWGGCGEVPFWRGDCVDEEGFKIPGSERSLLACGVVWKRLGIEGTG